MKRQTLYCAIDVGTSGVKVGLIDPVGRIERFALRTYHVDRPARGIATQQIEMLWNAQCEALREATADIDPSRIMAVAMSSQRGTFGLIYKDGTIETDMISWQDARGKLQCDFLRAKFGEEEYHKITGLGVGPIAAVSKIMWLREMKPDKFANVACFAPHQTILLRQLGVTESFCSPSEASYTGLYRLDGLGWSSGILKASGILPNTLPTVVQSGRQVGRISIQAAKASGLPVGLPIVMGGGDLQLGILGIGAADAATASCGIGTGGAITISSDQPIVDPAGRIDTLFHVVPGLYEIEGLARTAGGAMQWFKETLGEAETARAATEGGDAFSYLSDLAETSVPGSSGITFVPALAGLGVPVSDPDFSGALYGLRLSHGKGAIVRALMEGITYELRGILDEMASFAGPINDLRIWSGATKSDFWCQMQSDIFARPVSRTVESESPLIGAAICAAIGVGDISDFTEGASRMVHVARTWIPDPDRVRAYSHGYARNRRLINVLRESGFSAFEQSV